MEPLQRLNISQRRCSNRECARLFTATVRGKACAGCKLRFYCDANCQKEAWREHKDACKRQQKEIRKWETEGVGQGPPISQHLGAYASMSTCSNIVRAIARSALRLGRSDSLALSHFLHFRLSYNPPPKERWSSTVAKPVGDEHSFFNFEDVSLLPDECLEDREPGKKRKCDEMRRYPDESVFLAIFDAEQVSGEGVGKTGHHIAYFLIPHSSSIHPDPDLTWEERASLYPEFQISFDERKLNPQWFELLSGAKVLPVPTNREEEHSGYLRVELRDLEMSDDLHFLSKLPLPPGAESWKDFKKRKGADK